MSDEAIRARFWEPLCAKADSHGKTPLNKIPGCWHLALDDKWEIAVNGHNEQMPCREFSQHIGEDIKVPPFSVYVQFNGWPAGIIDPYGAFIAHGTIANYAALVEALER